MSATASASHKLNVPSPKKRVNNPYAYGEHLKQQQLLQQKQQQHEDTNSIVRVAALEGSPRADQCCASSSFYEDGAAGSSGRNSLRGASSHHGGSSDTESPSLSRDESFLQPPAASVYGHFPQLPSDYSIMPPPPPLPAHLVLGAMMPQLPTGMPQRNKAVICKRHLEGGRSGCALGGLCPYRHLLCPAQLDPVPRSVCKFAHCLRDTCPFFHGTEHQLRQLHAAGHTTYAPALVCEVRDAEADMSNTNSHISSGMPTAFMGSVPPPPMLMM